MYFKEVWIFFKIQKQFLTFFNLMSSKKLKNFDLWIHQLKFLKISDLKAKNYAAVNLSRFVPLMLCADLPCGDRVLSENGNFWDLIRQDWHLSKNLITKSNRSTFQNFQILTLKIIFFKIFIISWLKDGLLIFFYKQSFL